MPSRFRGNDAALLQRIVLGLCADHLEVQRAGVTVLVQDADVAEQIDIAPPVGLVVWRTGIALPAFAVANVHVLDPRDHRGDRLNRVLTRTVDVGRIHIDPKGGRGDLLHRPERGRGVIDARPNVGFDAQRHAILFGHRRQTAQRVDHLRPQRLVIRLAARPTVHDRDAQLDRRLERLFHSLRVLARLLHRQELQPILF